MRFRYVKDPHWLPAGRLKGEAAKFFPELAPIPNALIAMHPTYKRGAIAGWFRYEVTTKDDRVKLYAAGTWVEPFYRECGLAFELWHRVIERHDPDRIIVRTISSAGRKLVASLVREFEGRAFEVLV